MATSNPLSVKCGVVLAVAAFALAWPGAAGASVKVWLISQGKPVPVTRAGVTIQAAVEQLMAGPTASERRKGFRSAVPSRTPVRSVTVARRVVTVDLGARFAASRDEAGLRDRVGQLVRTVRGIPGVVSVRILIEGGVPIGLFPDYDLRRPVVAPVELVERPPRIRDLQRRLVDLGFLAPSGVSGSADAQTATAAVGFQKWANLTRDGVLNAATVAALLKATRPEPALRTAGRRIEVQLRRQVALLIQDNKVVRAVHISSGAGGLTPRGSFSIYRKERYSWSVPFKVWLPWASYFTGGIAFHEYGSVPTYPASHGCVRVNQYDAPLLFGFAESGTRVDVLDEAAVA